MMDTKIEIVLDSITALVDADEPWRTKRDKVMELSLGNERWTTALSEFLGWFESEPDEEEEEDEGTEV
jgi:hypothetical protein